MEAGGLSRACWTAPWFAAVAAGARGIDWSDPPGALAALDARASAAGIVTATGLPLRFVDAASLEVPAYEAHIFATGQVPTRTSGDGFCHDALNALAWLRFPRVKARLNALQAREIARDGLGERRGPLRDAATLFDENAVVLAVSRHDAPARSVLDALRAHDWHAAFVAGRDAWGRGLVPIVFGHALMQKLLRPFPSITAHAWALDVPPSCVGPDADAWCRAVDAALPASLETMLRSREARMPLPVMGVPGWCADNAAPAFYEDVAVFRPRSGRATR